MIDYDKKLNQEFFQKYPLCFPNGYPRCGFDSGYGWWSILDKLCADITAVLEKLPEDERKEFQVAQVKEKFGTLRFYVDNANDEIYKLIDEAEKQSCSICEDCGNPGSLRSVGWVKTRCNTCHRQAELKRNGVITVKLL